MWLIKIKRILRKRPRSGNAILRTLAVAERKVSAKKSTQRRLVKLSVSLAPAPWSHLASTAIPLVSAMLGRRMLSALNVTIAVIVTLLKWRYPTPARILFLAKALPAEDRETKVRTVIGSGARDTTTREETDGKQKIKEEEKYEKVLL